jgi:hypothetical protein
MDLTIFKKDHNPTNIGLNLLPEGDISKIK